MRGFVIFERSKYIYNDKICSFKNTEFEQGTHLVSGPCRRQYPAGMHGHRHSTAADILQRRLSHNDAVSGPDATRDLRDIAAVVGNTGAAAGRAGGQ